MRLHVVVWTLALACGGHGQSPPDDNLDAPKLDANGDAIAPPDTRVCVQQPCDVLTQCGCASFDACDVDRSDLDGTTCRAATPTGNETAACTVDTQCASGFVCLDGPGGQSCKRYCDENIDCGTPRGRCALAVTDGGGIPVAGVPLVCSSNCDPTNVGAGGCPSNTKCGLFTVGATKVVDCALAGAGVQGTNCGPAPGNDALCGPNFLCTTISAAITCRRICNKTLGGGCGGLTCTSFNPAFTVGGTEYGVCN